MESAPRSSRFFWPGLLVVLILGLFIPNLAMRLPALDLPGSRDLAYQWNPYYHFLRDTYINYHSFPLWNPYDLCGTPFLAFSHSSALYLLNFWYLLADFPLAMTLAALTHLLIAGLGCFYLLRAFGAGQPSSFICALAYAAAGFVFNNLNFPASLYSAAWLPWVCLFAARLSNYRRSADFAIFVALNSLALYGGDLEVAGFGMIAAFALQFFAKPKAPAWKPCLKAGLLFMLGAIFAGIIYCAQFLPALELMGNSIRAGAQIRLSISPLQVVSTLAAVAGSMLYPYPFKVGAFTTLKGMNWFYLGAVPLIGFACGLRISRQNRKMLWFFVAAALYAAAAAIPPLNKIIRHLPFLGQSLVPLRIVPALEIVFLIIAARGLDHIFKTTRQNFPRPETALMALLAIAGAVVTIIAAGQFPAGALALRLGSCALLLGLAFLPKARSARPLLFALAGLDLYAWALIHFPRSDYSSFRFSTELEKFAAYSDPGSRYFIHGALVPDAELPYSAGMIIKAAAIDGWTRTPLRNYAELAAIAFPRILVRPAGKTIFYDQMAWRDLNQVSPETAYILDLMNVRWCFARVKPGAQSPLQWREVVSGPVFVLENEKALDRAFLVRRIKMTGSQTQVLKLMAEGDFGPQRVALVAAGTVAEEQDPGQEQEFDKVKIERPRADALSASFSAPEKAWLFASEAYMPGWKAFIGDQETRILRADYAFRAVAAPAGKHEIRFTYQPHAFRIGLFASLTAAASLISLFVASLKRTPKTRIH